MAPVIVRFAIAAIILLAAVCWSQPGKGPSKWQIPFLGVVTPPNNERHSQPPEFGDQYGGTSIRVQKGTGFFTIAKAGNRWTLVTPEGNAFWMRGMQHANDGYMDRAVLQQKYGGNLNQWAVQRNRRLLAWGFNAIGEYHEDRGLPVGVYGSNEGNPVKLPFVVFSNVLLQGFNTPGRLGLPDPLKSITAGISTTYYDGWRGLVLDVYDPHAPDAYRAAIANSVKTFTGGFANDPWVVGITLDDSDVMFALKGGPKGRVNQYPHPVYLIAITNFWYTSANDEQGRNFKDHKLYAKYAWVDFLKKKYGTIDALNAAWGSNYSTFDDDGGWGEGHGLLDEDGRHRAWLGRDFYGLSDTKPAVRSDMDTFLYEFARHYADTAVKAIREVDRHHLIFGPIALNSWGARARDQVLRGMADGGFDMFYLAFDPVHPDLRDDNETYDITGKPAMMWYGVNANRDSAMHAVSPIYGAPDFPTQQERGAAYARDLLDFYNARGKNGDYYIMGIDFWELGDNYRENTNWGVLTRKDNAYDGKEAVRNAGKDAAGLPTGGEDRDYGDFLTSVRNANLEIQDRLTRDLSSFAQGPGKGKKP